MDKRYIDALFNLYIYIYIYRERERERESEREREKMYIERDVYIK